MTGVSAGILAGGASSRMGANKALLPFRGRPLLARQVEVLAGIASEVLIGANDPAPYRGFPARVVPDLLAQRSALSGLHGLVSASSNPRTLVIACDLPFLNGDLLRFLLLVDPGADVVIPVSDRGPEPLHAVYSKACLPAMERATAGDDWKATGFHRLVRVREVRVRDGDWIVEGRSPFLNANTPEEWREAVGTA